MGHDAQKRVASRTMVGKGNGGGRELFLCHSFSRYFRIMSSGASNLASTVKSAGVSVISSLADDVTSRDQVQWSGFDMLEFKDNYANVHRQVLLLGYRSGFEVWDIEQSDDVRRIASRCDGHVSFLQVQKIPIASKRSMDTFQEVRPLLVVARDVCSSNGFNNHDGIVSSVNSNNGSHELGNGNFAPSSIQFYSLKKNVYVHTMRFLSPIYSIRCSPRVVAVLLATQIQCFDSATLEREYTVMTHPIVPCSLRPGGVGYGPLAVGSRWLAYSGNPVVFASTDRVNPQHLTPTTLNGSFVAQFAKESSMQLASGIMTLGDKGYRKLSRYCSDVLLQDGSNSLKQRNSSAKTNVTPSSHSPNTENVGMVIVRDFVSKCVVVQFRAHTSPISALCFDPSGILLVTASIHGHNINIFHVIPSSLGCSHANGTYVHLYRLQRGFTDAIIQDISFSDDNDYIMISSSRGTSHLFALSITRESTSHPYNVFSTGPPITLFAISRIKNGSNGWKEVVSDAAASTTGRINQLCGTIASTFHNCKGEGVYPDFNSLRRKYFILVFSPSGCIIQYVLHDSIEAKSGTNLLGLNSGSNEHFEETNTGMVVEALQKWDVCDKQNRRDRIDDINMYGENGNGDSTTILTKGSKRGSGIHPIGSGTETKMLTIKEKHHSYISEMELHTHSTPQNSLWARQNISYLKMMSNSSEDDVSSMDGEIEVETFRTRPIEAMSKDLRQASHHPQIPRNQQPRMNGIESNRSKSFIGWVSKDPSSESLFDFVNNSDNACVGSQLKCVNNDEGSKAGIRRVSCLNNLESSKMKNHSEDGDSDVN